MFNQHSVNLNSIRIKGGIMKTESISLLIVVTFMFNTALLAQGSGSGDVLNEVPFYVVPADMTFEEYEDANRRLSVGLLLMTIPVPGALHFYANEKKEGWRHVYAAAAGLASIIAGIASIDEKDTWPESEFETVDFTGDDLTVRRYEKIPVKAENDSITYRLRFLNHDTEGGGKFLIVLGVGLIIGEIFHDWYDGIKTIEKKRNAVRFKYGKSSNFGFNLSPEIDPESGLLGAKLSLSF